MNILSVKNPRFNAGGTIDMEIEIAVGEFIPFTASADDVEPHGVELYGLAVAGEFGVVAAAPTISIDQYKAEACASIDRMRETKLRDGFLFNGGLFQNDTTSMLRIAGAFSLALAAKAALNSSWSKSWIIADNTVVTLSADDMIAVGEAAAAHEQEMIYIGHAHKQAVLALTDIESVIGYDYSLGW
jgi:hypothetical protein